MDYEAMCNQMDLVQIVGNLVDHQIETMPIGANAPHLNEGFQRYGQLSARMGEGVLRNDTFAFIFNTNFTITEAMDRYSLFVGPLAEYIQSLRGDIFYNSILATDPPQDGAAAGGAAAQGADQPRYTWLRAARDSEAELTIEPKSILFLNAQSKVVDWVRTLNSLKKLFNERSYTMSHCLNSLLRILQRYDESSYDYFKDYQDPNVVANELISSQLRLDKRPYYRSQIDDLQRSPSDSLRKIMNTLKALAKLVYPGVEDLDKFNNLMIVGLLSFVCDDLSVSLKSFIEKSSVMGRTFFWEDHLERIQTVEIQRGIKINSPLSFGRIIGQKNVNLFNTTLSLDSDFNNFYSPKGKNHTGTVPESYSYNYDNDKFIPNLNPPGAPQRVEANLVEEPPLRPASPAVTRRQARIAQDLQHPPDAVPPTPEVRTNYVHPVQVKSNDRSFTPQNRGRSPFKRGNIPPNDFKPYDNRRNSQSGQSPNYRKDFRSNQGSDYRKNSGFRNRSLSQGRENYNRQGYDKRSRSPSFSTFNRDRRQSGNYRPSSKDHRGSSGYNSRYPRSPSSNNRSSGFTRSYPSRNRSDSRNRTQRSTERYRSNSRNFRDGRSPAWGERKNSFRDRSSRFERSSRDNSRQGRDRYRNGFKSRSRENSFHRNKSYNRFPSRDRSYSGTRSDILDFRRDRRGYSPRSPARDSYNKHKIDGVKNYLPRKNDSYSPRKNDSYSPRKNDSYSPRINSIQTDQSEDDGPPLTNIGKLGASLVELGNTLANSK